MSSTSRAPHRRFGTAKATVTGGVLVFHDVSAKSRELNRRLSYHASHDILTGLVNRREFESRLERALKSAKARENLHMRCCYLDLDQFKIVNDSCGHSGRRYALLGPDSGTLLKSKIRWRDTLARLGGDEFGVLLESCSLEEAMKTAEIAALWRSAEYKFVWDDRSFPSRASSIGVVPITADNEDVAALLSAADSACHGGEGSRTAIASTVSRRTISISCAAAARCSGRRSINNALEEEPLRVVPADHPAATRRRGSGAHYEILLRMRDEIR